MRGKPGLTRWVVARGGGGHSRLILARLDAIRSRPGDGRCDGLRAAGLDVRDGLRGAIVAIAVGSDGLGNENERLGLANRVENGCDLVFSMASKKKQGIFHKDSLFARGVVVMPRTIVGVACGKKSVHAPRVIQEVRSQ